MSKNHEEYVVKKNAGTDLYLVSYDPDPERNVWGSPEEAMTFGTLIEAQNLAAQIGGGTVGTTKP